LVIYSVFVGSGATVSELSEAEQATIANMREYSQRHGADFVLVLDALGAEKPHWTKVIVLDRLLKRTAYNWVLYPDYDAIFVDMRKDPLDYMVPMLRAENASFLIANHNSMNNHKLACESVYAKNVTAIRRAAVLDENVKHVWSCSPNSGSFFAQNDEVARAISTAWMDSYNVSDHGIVWCANGGTLHDQGALNLEVTPRFIGGKGMAVVSRQYINGFDGIFIRHFLGRAKHEKEAFILATLDALNVTDAVPKVIRHYDEIAEKHK
jgi:galactosyl transferase GMA12/MNN10 family